MNFIKDLSLDKIQNLAEDAYNQAKPKTDVEARVYEVLSHKNWGASGSLMNEIARDTYNVEKYQVIASLMWDGMENQRPAAWKIVFKSLTLLDHLIKNGAERCVDDARNHGHVLRSLGQFNYYEGTIDRGLGVREKSKQILEVLSEDDRVREERQKSRKLREKFGNFNTGASGVSGGGGGGEMGGYGNQDSWDAGGRDGGSGYGEGGIYDNDKGYAGRYAGGNSSVTQSSSTPTFAAIPGESSTKKKSKKKKKKQSVAVKQEATPAAAAEPEEDLLGFDSVPSAVTQSENTGSSEFGAFQASTAPAPAPVDTSEEFATFGQMRSVKAASGPDPFASTPPVQQQTPSFDAFGNNSGGNINNNLMMNNTAPMINNTTVTNNNGVTGMQNAFGNMNVGLNAPTGNTQQFQPQTNPASNDDDFGDFADAKKNVAPSLSSNMAKSSDPMSSLINLNDLTKNPSKKMTMNQPIKIDEAAAQYQKDIQQGTNTSGSNLPNTQVAVSAGGSDAISSMMGPAPTQQQQQRGSMMSMNSQPSAEPGAMNPQMQQQQFMMNQMQNNQGMQFMGGNPHMQGMNTGGGVMNPMQNMMMNQMQNQGMQGNQNMNMMGGNPQMQGMMMNQMGMNQAGMNQMGMNNQMGFQQQQSFNPQMGGTGGHQQMR